MEKHNTDKQKRHPSFGKIMLASAVGALIALVCVGIIKLLILFGLIGSVSTEGSAKTLNAKDAFLKIDLTKPMSERTPSDLTALFDAGSAVGFADLVRAIDAAAEDQNIKGIYLYFGPEYPHSWGHSEELRQALTRFSDSGKPVLAYSDSYTQQGYFVASIADSIYLNPGGGLDFRGLGAEVLYYKELLDKLEVKMSLIRPKSNDYKSAGETYTMNHMSDANRRQIREYIVSIWDYVVDQIAEARDIPAAELNRIADNLDAFLPEDAVKNRLIDRTGFESDVCKAMKETFGAKATVALGDYVQTLNRKAEQKERIAIIYAEGDVQTGKGFGRGVYSDMITKALDDAAKDEKIKAIVLRINSPGGAVIASETMTDAVRRAKTKKPVVVSMGDVAASAGYEMSCYADYIVAEPTTITGSIGVFAILPEVGGTLRKYLGITTDTVKTNANATALSLLRPASPRASELLQQNVEDFYTVFVGRVAEGRKLEYNYVDSIARGRVWTGREALKLGLVDALGGLDDAVAVAAERAKIENYHVVDYPSNKDILTELKESKESTSTLTVQSGEALQGLPSALPVAGDGVWVPGEVMRGLLDPLLDCRGLQARVPFFILTD